jgi:hypothetical protein
MANPHYENPAGGPLRRFISKVLLLVITLIGVVMYFVIQPQDLSDIDGHAPAAGQTSPRNLTAVLQASVQRGHSVTLTEAEINRWLGSTLKASQRGPLAEYATFERVWVRLEDGFAEIIMERKVLDRPLTVSMFVKIEQTQGDKGRLRTIIHRHGGPYSPNLPKLMRGGRFGTVIMPQGFLTLVIPAYAQLADLYREEIRLAFEEMALIRIEKNRLVLEPRLRQAAIESF